MTRHAPTMQQLPLALGTAAPQRFDNFLPGANDQWSQVLAALRAPHPATPVLLWGPSGSGKTHLLHAAAAHQQALGHQVAAFDADTPLPWCLEEGVRLILLDRCNDYDAARQHAAFTLFVEAASQAVPIIAAASAPPVDLALRDDLRTRLGWGLVYQLVPPTEAEVRALLRREADRRGILLSEDVMDYLLTRHARNLSHLMDLLDRLDHFSLAFKRAVTVPLLKQMLAAQTGASV
jgi:DnaA family protein